jgi:hypothetical protein
MHEVHCRVALLPSLQLLFELDMLPTNQWAHITELWRSSSSPLLLISPGIQFNPNKFAGLHNFDIETMDLVGVWTGGNLKTISIACGSKMECEDMKQTFYITLSSHNYWTVSHNKLQAWALSTQLKHIKYVGRLDPELVATWLQEMGLTAYDVLAQFFPFTHWTYNTNVITNPRASFTLFTPPEAPPSSTDDSLSYFGDDVNWTLPSGPHGPALKLRQSENPNSFYSHTLANRYEIPKLGDEITSYQHFDRLASQWPQRKMFAATPQHELENSSEKKLIENRILIAHQNLRKRGRIPKVIPTVSSMKKYIFL